MAVIRTSSCLFLALFANQLVAQEILFQSNFDSDEGLVVLPGTDDTRFEFGYDYADFDGIPEAPNSGLTAGSGQSGLKLEANIEAAEAAAIVVVTDGLELAGMYEVQLDVWLNYNFLAANAVGTTEYGGLGVGHDGEFGGLSGASFIYDTDGDSSRDYILYKDLTRQEIESGQYAVESMNNSSDVFVEAFPAVDIAEKVPLQALVGNTPEGSGGFRWMTVHALVDTDGIGAGTTDDRGTARFTITDADTGNSIEIGTIDNSSGEGVANMSGNVAVLFADLFSSVSNRDDYSFGIFDNLIISSVADASSPLDCNDDGLVDAGDIGCATEDSIAQTLEAAGIVPGDLDSNGAVEFADFLTLSQNFGDVEAAGAYANGDIDLNGAIEFADFLVISENFGTSTEAASVPEPASFALLGFVILLVGKVRRRCA